MMRIMFGFTASAARVTTPPAVNTREQIRRIFRQLGNLVMGNESSEGEGPRSSEGSRLVRSLFPQPRRIGPLGENLPLGYGPPFP